jgi:hypothetical protein
MIGTILKNPTEGYENIFAGNFDELPEDRNEVLIYEGGFIAPKWNGSEWIESQTLEQVNQIKINKAIEIDLYYTKKINDLMMKHYNKIQKHNYFELTPYVVPESAWIEEQALKNECNAKILALGITDFSYRQNVPKLAKVEI